MGGGADSFDVFVPEYALSMSENNKETQFLTCASESTQKTALVHSVLTYGSSTESALLEFVETFVFKV